MQKIFGLSLRGLASLLLLSVALSAAAQTRHEQVVRPTLSELPPELDGILVELRQTVRPQLAIFNLTTEPLYILDDNGRPFLSIGPQDVKGNYAVPDFHVSRYAVDRRMPNNAHGADRWHQISEAPTWGWFDTRLLIPADRNSGNWRVPVQLGATKSQISGTFLHSPALNGVFRAVIDKQDLGMKDVSVHPLAGHQPGLMIHARGNDKFNVGGLKGEKFLRFLPSKTLVNRSSNTWKKAAPEQTVVPYIPPGDEPESWAIISTDGGFSWRDPRLLPSTKKPGGKAVKTVATWKIPVETSGGTRYIEGHTEWVP